MFPDPKKKVAGTVVCVCVCVCVCLCVCVFVWRGNRESRLCSRCQQRKKTRTSNAKSPHEESENHRNIRFQMQCNDIVILANKQEVKCNCHVWNLFQK